MLLQPKLKLPLTSILEGRGPCGGLFLSWKANDTPVIHMPLDRKM